MLLEIYMYGVADTDKIIEKAHGIRNSNPLSHLSAELADNNNTAVDILNSIEQLGYLIETKIAEYETPDNNYSVS